MSAVEQDKVIVGQLFRLEDREGKKYAELKLNTEGLPVFVLYDKAEKQRIIIGLGVDEEAEEIATVCLCDANEEEQAGIVVTAKGEQEFFGFAEMVKRNMARNREEEEVTKK